MPHESALGVFAALLVVERHLLSEVESRLEDALGDH